MRILRPYEQDTYVVEASRPVRLEPGDKRLALFDSYLQDPDAHWLALNTCWGEYPQLWSILRAYERAGGEPEQRCTWNVFARYTGTQRLAYNPHVMLHAAPWRLEEWGK